MFLNHRIVVTFTAAAITLLASCSREAGNNSSSLRDDADPWAKQAWLDKAARALRFGDGIGPSDNPDALAAKSPEEIVDFLMQDPRFVETVLDFNLYFLNFKPGKLYSYTGLNEKKYDDVVFKMPHALTAAKAVATNGDYFTLFNYDQPFYISAFGKPSGGSNSSNGGSGGGTAPQLSDRDRRLAQLNKALAVHDEITAIFKPSDGHTPDAQVLCGQINEKFTNLVDLLYYSGVPEQLETAYRTLYLDVMAICFAAQDQLDPQGVYQSLVARRDNYSKLMAIADHPAATNYHITTPADIISIDPATYGVSEEITQFTDVLWDALQNSSTNYNRRRSAYVLKTFFCDDLTPVNIALPQSHVGNKHADDPGCAACHYKLDPMAGFFRHRGSGGISFENRDHLIFDDTATISGAKLSDYLDSWRAPAGAGRAWNVGYIRSPKKTQLNSYGETLRDLTKILHEAKEVRQCLTRRMAEYFLGKGQVFDGEWINSLSAKFEEAASSNGSATTSKAFKAVVKDLVLSKTFMTQDPEPTKCYDFAPGHQPTTLPCEIAFVIKKNCSSCHSGDGASGNLDLTKWQQVSTGTFTFAHTDEAGHQLPKSESLKRLLDRLSTNDESKLMPLNKYMSAIERAQLYKWVNKEAEAANGGH